MSLKYRIARIIATLITFSNVALITEVRASEVLTTKVWVSEATPTSEEIPDLDFIEWLGQVSEAEELGVDIDKLIDMKEQDPQTEEQEQSE